jgi:Helix-turn-helix family
MSTPFGPQLIGETEKTLNALLRRFLEGTGLNESQWVTLRLADRLDGSLDANGLVAAVADRAHLSNAAELVSELARRGLMDDGRLTSAGRAMTAAIRTTIATTTAPIWEDLSNEDVAGATRVLNEIVTRARAVLASGRFSPVSAKNV